MTPEFSTSPADGNAVVIDRVSKIYRSHNGRPPKHALTDMSLNIPCGSIFGLLGPNGAGKSTLINILAGTVVKTSGTARVWGVDIDADPRQARASIGVVPQELNNDAFFTPRETLEMMAGMFGVPSHERQTDAILEDIGLTEQANAYARTLSGGMRRRLLVGKAMVHQPPVLVLDEPTAGVDVALRMRLWEMIRTLNRKGVTIILTTHYLEEAEALCDRIAIINHGRLIREDTTSRLLAGAGSKDMVVRLERMPRAVPETLAGLNVTLGEGELRINFSPEDLKAEDILGRISSAGLRIADISIEEPDLEDVFLALTSPAKEG
ncbi:ABC transporter ATP-binding protein [Alphaproteobacteria bacterium LSUCC0684]